jgi:glycosyltransferase involved in cell wall biosynthesis
VKRSRSGQHLSRANRPDEPKEDRPESSLDILILGPVPPPFGGVSMHLARLVPRLQRAGFRVGVLNHFRSTDRAFVVGALNRNPLKYYFLPKKFRTRILHYRHSRWPQLVATALGKGSSKARYIVTLHSGDIDKQFPHLTTRKPLVGRITRWALRRFDTVIAVNPGSHRL